ncbi:uncharacterized protein TNCV_4966071 [Trichonephila clavipes]|nr:uncharacterized protein TNCV_4966071 [Trichonephila clavipes]
MLLLSSSSIWGLFLKATLFRYPHRQNSGIDKSGERGGQSPLEMTRSSKNSVKISILSHDVCLVAPPVMLQPRYRLLLITKDMKSIKMFVTMDGLSFGLLCKEISTSATFISSMKALLDLFLSATDSVSRNRCTKRVIVDASGAVSPGYFC